MLINYYYKIKKKTISEIRIIIIMIHIKQTKKGIKEFEDIASLLKADFTQ